MVWAPGPHHQADPRASRASRPGPSARDPVRAEAGPAVRRRTAGGPVAVGLAAPPGDHLPDAQLPATQRPAGRPPAVRSDAPPRPRTPTRTPSVGRSPARRPVGHAHAARAGAPARERSSVPLRAPSRGPWPRTPRPVPASRASVMGVDHLGGSTPGARHLRLDDPGRLQPRSRRVSTNTEATLACARSHRPVRRSDPRASRPGPPAACSQDRVPPSAGSTGRLADRVAGERPASRAREGRAPRSPPGTGPARGPGEAHGRFALEDL